jgi:hypothetical protein
VVGLIAGCFFAVLVPWAIRQQRGSMLDNAHSSMFMAGLACFCLGLGGADAASLAGAHALAGWLGVAALVGVGIVVLACVIGAVKSRWAPTRGATH